MSLLQSLGLKSKPDPSEAQAAPTQPAAAGADGSGTGDDNKVAAAKLKGQLETQLDDWRTQYDRVAPAQAWLEERIKVSKGAEKAEWQGKKAELDKKAAEAQRRIKQADADIRALDDPRSDASTYNAILARQKSAAKIDPKTEIDAHDGKLEQKLTERKVSRTTTAYADGKATTRTDESTKSIGADGLGKKNVSSKETVTADGRKSVSDESKTSVGPGGVTYDRKVRAETEKDGETTSIEKTTSAKIGADGASRTDTRTTTQADGSAKSDSRTSAVERGDGKLGAKREQSTTRTDADGNEEKTTTTSKGGIVAGKDGMGAYGEREQAFERKGKNGLTTGAVAGLNANVVCNVKAIDGTPPTYDLSISINLGVSASLSASGEKTSKGEGSKGTVGAKASGSMAVSMNRHYVLSATEAEAYVASLKAASAGGGGGGGTQQEFAVISTGVSKSWDAAREMYLAFSGKALAPAEVDKLKAGESVEFSNKKKAGGGVSADAKGVGVEAGYEIGHDESMKVTKEKDGTLTYDTAQGDSEKVSGGAKIGVGVVEGGASVSHTQTTSTGYKISIDPTAKNAAEMQAALAACKDQRALDAFAAKYPQSVQEKTVAKGTADTQGASIGIAGAKATLGYGNSVAEEVTTDKDGNLKGKKVTGANQGGLDISVGKYKIGSSGEEKAVAEIDAEGNATVDVGKTSTSTDSVKFLTAHVPGMKDKGADKKGLLTTAAGGEEPDTDVKDVQGIKLKGGDLTYLGHLACNDQRKWMSACPSPRMIDDWRAAGNAIKRAGGSQAAVASELAKFVGADSVGRADVVNALVRPSGDVSSGSRYEFPDALAKHKANYDALVIADSEAGLDALAKGADGAKKAADAGAELLAKLESLYIAIANGQGFTQPAVQGEMLGAINARKQKVQAKLRVLGGGKADELSAKEVMDKYNELLRTCTNYKHIETGCFGTIAKFYADGGNPNLGETIEIGKLVKQLRDLHATWAPAYDEMAGLAQEHGFGKGIYSQYKPDYSRFQRAIKGNPGDASPVQEETADKRKKPAPPPPPAASKDPVGDSDRELKKKMAATATAKEAALPAAKNRAYGAGNSLAKKLSEERRTGAVTRHNEGMVKLKSADANAKRVRPGNEGDLLAWGHIAIEDYDAATKLFREGLAMYPAKAKSV